MSRSSHLFLTAALLFAGLPGGAFAQAVVQPLPGTTDADKLADAMRRLATNPRDVDALVRAGELSLGLGDLSGAAALFARAEKVNPRDGRVKAGMASILVRSERPGEALRYFAQAEGLGLPPRYFAADRALAYDLIGQQERAQRDYRVALRDTPDDETTRRYALSLGISGRREPALQLLDPLIRKTDRGAWRARAFILAMTNDVSGAETIATTMMPGTMAQGLLPFFRRLPALAPADRAFAVHFGEVSPTPERIADARMTPPLPVLGPDPTAPVMMAAAEPVAAPEQGGKRGRKGKPLKPGRTEMAAVVPITAIRTPTPTPAPTVAALPPRTASPVVRPQAQTSTVFAANAPVVQPVPTPTPAPMSAAAPVAVAQATSSPAPVVTKSPVTVAVASAGKVPGRATTGELPQSVATQMAALPPATGATPIVSRAGATTLAPTAVEASAVTPARIDPAPVAAPTPVARVAPATQVAPAPAPAPATHVAPASEDSILARIIAGLSIPASELGVGPPSAPVTTTPPPVVAGTTVTFEGAKVMAEAKAKADRDAAAEKLAAEKLAAQKLAADKKAAEKKAAADRKALAEKKAAAEKKAIADKEAAEEKRIARANPSRIWVQVAGGATEGDLPKAWSAVKAKAPDVFGARGGWTTPLRATNRVLAGPFKTDAEARTFVNQLAKAGVSAFGFTSDAGQVVTKLPAK